MLKELSPLMLRDEPADNKCDWMLAVHLLPDLEDNLLLDNTMPDLFADLFALDMPERSEQLVAAEWPLELFEDGGLLDDADDSVGVCGDGPEAGRHLDQVELRLIVDRGPLPVRPEMRAVQLDGQLVGSDGHLAPAGGDAHVWQAA